MEVHSGATWQIRLNDYGQRLYKAGLLPWVETLPLPEVTWAMLFICYTCDAVLGRYRLWPCPPASCGKCTSCFREYVFTFFFRFQKKRVFTARRYASTIYAVIVCLCLSHFGMVSKILRFFQMAAAAILDL